MVHILIKDNHSAYGIRHFVADEEKDVTSIETKSLEPGSSVFVIENSKTFMLNSSKLWIQIKTNSSGGGGGGNFDGIYDGGGVIPGAPSPDGGNAKR